tara:strand:- start:1625 stop:2848 length:1224 start_codon:yes stop_codon:yes gene_type:complete
MTIKILMPSLSPTMTEGNLTKWLVKEGDQVKAGDVIAEIETDKATMEVEAVDEGIITSLVVKEGSSSVPVNSTIAILDGNESDQVNLKDDHAKDIKTEEENNFSKEKDDLIIQDNNISDKNIKSKDKTINASPYVKASAKQNKIDLKNIVGSGPKGRIIKRDLENNTFLSNNKNNNEVIEPSSIRKIIAERTTKTKQTVPHYYLTIESNVDKLINMRKKINDSQKNKISINDILVKALAESQKKNPKTNVSWQNGKIVKFNTIDVSVAVALEEGLITPIIKNADTKGINEISNEIKDLADKAKKGKLTPEDYDGGTISISNLGMFGITEFSAILNPPQSLILSVGVIKKIPIVMDEEIKVANILKSSLSVDHRTLDGAVAAKLLKDFNDILEDPFDLWLNSDDMKVI